MRLFISTLILFMVLNLSAQNVGIGTNNPQELAKLDIKSSTSGVLLPQMTTVQRGTLGSNVSALGASLSATYNGLIVYDTDDNTMYMWDATKTEFTNGGWSNILDADANVDDNDADPNNEIQDLSISDDLLSLSGDATPVDLSSLKDHDWYESTGTDQADNIGDNIYTNGRVAIGTTSTSEGLSVYPDTENSAEIGRVHIGTMGHNDWAGFSHVDANSTTNYALLQNDNGRTLLNAATNEKIDFRIGNSSQFEMQSDGDLYMLGDNTIHMANNVAYVKRTGVFSPNSSADSYYNVTDYTGFIQVESGDVLKVEAVWNARMEGGSGNDDFYIRVNADGVTCADRNFNESGWIRPDEGGSDHDNFQPMSYMDYWVANCDGTMRFRLQIRNTGDDDWQAQDIVLFVTKY